MNFITLETTCPFCGKPHNVSILEESYLDWKDGELAQNAFPYLSATEREQIISGICPSCQAEVFAEPTEKEEEDDWDYDYDEVGFNPYMGSYDFDC